MRELLVFGQLAAPLTRPTHIVSIMQLAKRARISDDKARRILAGLERQLNRKLFASDQNRIVLTPAGKKLNRIAGDLAALLQQEEEPAEMVTIEADPLLVESLVTEVLGDFLDSWEGLVQVRICPLGPSVRSNILSGITSLGLGFADKSETVPEAELLGPVLPWVLIFSGSHRLAGRTGSITLDQLSGDDRLFVPGLAAECPGLLEALSGFPACNRIECDISGVEGMVKRVLGLGILPALDLDAQAEGLNSLVIKGVPSVQPRLYLPRKMSDPVQSLVLALKAAAEARIPQPEPPLAVPVQPAHTNGEAVEEVISA